MRIAVVQMNPGADKAANMGAAARLVEQAAADGAGLVVLPEMWTCLGGDRAGKFASAEVLPAEGAEEGDFAEGSAGRLLAGLARRLGIHVHGGSIGALDDSDTGHIFNTSLVFDPAGREIGRYRKIHLFDITTPDGQGYRESAVYGAGGRVVTCRVGETVLGLAICYDLRFGELFIELRRRGAELIALPSAFTLQTGKDHWEPLLRARAIETQCWVAAAATMGRHVEVGRDGPSERVTYGHSMVCDPWGHVVARASDGEGFASARMDAALTARVRAGMPVLEHRRLPGVTEVPA